MQTFSDDRDILKYEPVAFKDLYLPGQIAASGVSATLSGTTFTKAGETFVSKAVKAGNVIHLTSATTGIDTAFEIVSVDSETQLTISILRMDVDADAVSPGADASDYDYRIASFDPQANEALVQLTQYFGIAPGNPDSDYSTDDLLDADVLRSVSAFAVISALYATKASGLDGEDAYWDKSFYYRKKFEHARARCRVDVDLGKDGVKDLTRYANSPKLLRD